MSVRSIFVSLALAGACSSGPRGATFDNLCYCKLPDGGSQLLNKTARDDCSLTPEQMTQLCQQQPSTYFELDAGCAEPPQCSCAASVAPSDLDCG